MAEWNYLDVFEDLRLRAAALVVQPHWTAAMIPTFLDGVIPRPSSSSGARITNVNPRDPPLSLDFLSCESSQIGLNTYGVQSAEPSQV